MPKYNKGDRVRLVKAAPEEQAEYYPPVGATGTVEWYYPSTCGADDQYTVIWDVAPPIGSFYIYLLSEEETRTWFARSDRLEFVKGT